MGIIWDVPTSEFFQGSPATSADHWRSWTWFIPTRFSYLFIISITGCWIFLCLIRGRYGTCTVFKFNVFIDIYILFPFPFFFQYRTRLGCTGGKSAAASDAGQGPTSKFWHWMDLSFGVWLSVVSHPILWKSRKVCLHTTVDVPKSGSCAILICGSKKPEKWADHCPIIVLMVFCKCWFANCPTVWVFSCTTYRGLQFFKASNATTLVISVEISWQNPSPLDIRQQLNNPDHATWF